MQIIPTVLTFIFILSFIAYQFMNDFRISQTETRHVLARYNAERKVVNHRTKLVFEKMKENNPPKEAKPTSFFPRKDKRILQPHSLAPLLQNSPPQELVTFYKKLFLYYFSSITHEGYPVSSKDLLSEFSTWIAEAKRIKESDEGATIDWETLLGHSHFKTKLLEGTHRIDFEKRKGYPSIHEVFTFEEMNVPIAFSGLPETALPLLFTPSETALILEKEQEINKGYPLSVQELETLLPSKSILKHLYSRKKRVKTYLATDEKHVIEVQVEQ